MSDPQTNAIRLSQPIVGGDTGTWPTTLNNDWAYVDAAMFGLVTVAIGGLTSYTLTADGSSGDQARQQVILFNGALSADCTVTLPANNRFGGYVINATTGGHNVILTQGGNNLTLLPDSVYYFLFADGSNVYSPNLGCGTSSLTGVGNFTVGGADVSSSAVIRVIGASGSSRVLVLKTNDSARWDVTATSTSESGGNAGSNFVITRYNDSGTAVDFPVSITRSSGAMTLTANAGLTVADNSGFTPVKLSHGLASRSGYTGAFDTSHAVNFNTNGVTCNLFSNNTNLGTISTTSDRRVKENITDALPGALDRICALRPAAYNFKGDPHKALGFIADELQQVVPQAVFGEPGAVTPEGEIQPQSLKPLALIAELVGAVQELRREVERLKR
jgi:hypothetical protein